MNTHEAINLFSSRFSPPGLEGGGEVCVPSLTGCAGAFAALSLSLPQKNADGKAGVTLVVTPGLPEADRLADDLRILTGQKPGGQYEARILEFPPRLDDDKTALGTRLKTIAALRAWSLNPYPLVIVASYPALAVPIPAKAPSPIVLSGGGSSRFDEISKKLAESGYNRVPIVQEPGDYSIRGGILDVWSPGEEFPFRAEFFGDDLESLRTFDVASQISIRLLKEASQFYLIMLKSYAKG